MLTVDAVWGVTGTVAAVLLNTVLKMLSSLIVGSTVSGVEGSPMMTLIGPSFVAVLIGARMSWNWRGRTPPSRKIPVLLLFKPAGRAAAASAPG